MKLFMIVCFGVSGLISMIFQWEQMDDIFDLHYLEAKDNAQLSQKPLLLLFIQDNCQKCIKQKEMIEQDAELAKLIESKYETAVVNIDNFDGKAIRDYYQIQSAPGFLVVSHSGQIQWQHNGQLSKDNLIKQIGNGTEHKIPTGSTGLDPVPVDLIQKPSSQIVHIEQKATHYSPTEAENNLENQNLPAFQIQFGFFGSKTNAHNVLTKLIESGHSDCYIAEEIRDGKTFYRVLSPLFSDQGDARLVLQQTKVIGLEGAIKQVQ